MTLYPHVQTKAQEEIDRVVGIHRLPRFEDRPQMPYVEHVISELLRWARAVPLGDLQLVDVCDSFEALTFDTRNRPPTPKGRCLQWDVHARKEYCDG